MTTVAVIIWGEGEYPGDRRRLAMVGLVGVGAVFVPGPSGRFYRWRVWCTARMSPAEGTARNEIEAKDEVAKRFFEFLELARLRGAS